MKITLKQLIDLGACRHARKRFRELFGESVEVTDDLCVKHAEEFDWDWVASHLLSRKQLAQWYKDEDRLSNPSLFNLTQEGLSQYKLHLARAFARACAMEPVTPASEGERYATTS